MNNFADFDMEKILNLKNSDIFEAIMKSLFGIKQGIKTKHESDKDTSDLKENGTLTKKLGIMETIMPLLDDKSKKTALLIAAALKISIIISELKETLGNNSS